MKVYSFGAEGAPAILLLPGTCCHWKSNFGHVIPLLAQEYRVLCVSYDGFDETERTEFSGMLEETEKIETYIKEQCGGRVRAAYGCSLGAGRLVRGAAGGAAEDSYRLRHPGQFRSRSGFPACSEAANESAAADDLSADPRRAVQIPLFAKADGEMAQGSRRVCGRFPGAVRRRAPLRDAAQLQKPVLFGSRYAAAGKKSPFPVRKSISFTP